MQRLIHPLIVLIILLAIAGPVNAGGTSVVRFIVTEFIVKGDNPLTEKKTKAVMRIFLGEQEGITDLLEAAAELESALAAAGHFFHRVTLPPQSLQEEGPVILEVISFKLDDINVKGYKHFSPANIKASLPSLEPGKAPNTRKLAKELNIANEHPSKTVTARFMLDKDSEQVDVDLLVADEDPFRAYTIINNVGNDETGEIRITAGLQDNNLLDHDDSLSVTYTTSPGHEEDVEQYGFHYELPVYSLSGRVSLFYLISDVDSGRIQEVFDVSGEGEFAGLNYTRIFFDLDKGHYRHRMNIGIEDKLFINNVDFEGTPIGGEVRTRPLTLQYSGEFSGGQSISNFRLSYVHNLNGGTSNTPSAYAASRSNAEQNWNAVRYAASYNYSTATEWLLSANFSGQYTDRPLVSGELFYLGGVNSVRGFEESEVSGDRGQQLGLEIWAPSNEHQIQWFGFVDGGHMEVLLPEPGQADTATLISAGVGVTWNWLDKLILSLEYGRQIEAAEGSDADGGRTHFSMYYRFF